MPNSRPPIPEHIKLAVRRKCNFGCINPECRCPIWDYEHIIDYSEVQEHKEENIVLLCPTCNQARKGVQFPRRQLYEWVKNVGDQTRPERLYFDRPAIHLGTNVYPSGTLASGSVFRIGKNHLSFVHEEDFTLINGEFYNKTGQLSLRIENSRYVLFSQPWDINYNRGHRTKDTPGVLTFRNSSDDVFLQVVFQGNSNLIHVAGKFYFAPDQFITIDNGIYHGKMLLVRACIVEATSLGFWVCDRSACLSSLGGQLAVRNVRNVEGCRVVNATIGFLWDHDFLSFPNRTSYIGSVKFIVLEAEPLHAGTCFDPGQDRSMSLGG